MKTAGITKNHIRDHDDPHAHRVYTIYEVLNLTEHWTPYWRNRTQAIRNLLEAKGFPPRLPLTATGRDRKAPAALVAAFTGEEGLLVSKDELEALGPLLDLLAETPRIWDNLPFTGPEKLLLLDLRLKVKDHV